MRLVERVLSSRHGDPHLLADCPNEPGKFSRDGRDHHGGLLAIRPEEAVGSPAY